ncbi:hypothetical protein ACX818_001473 [Acinetobacter baumannii]
MTTLIYRLMCFGEYASCSKEFPISWKKKFKWFTDNPKFLERVADGRFNNSKFDWGRYDYLLIYEVDSLDAFKRVSDNELMLQRKDQPKVKIKLKAKIDAQKWFTTECKRDIIEVLTQYEKML